MAEKCGEFFRESGVIAAESEIERCSFECLVPGSRGFGLTP